jgi:hypothetical protein
LFFIDHDFPDEEVRHLSVTWIYFCSDAVSAVS